MKTIDYVNIVLDIFRCSVLVMVAPDRDTIISQYPIVYKKLGAKGDISQDIEDIKKVLDGDDNYKGSTFSFTNSGVDACVVLYAENISKITQEVIVHELYHAMKYICRVHGVDDEETEAYMLEYLCNQFWCAQDDYSAKHHKKKTNKK